MRAIRQEVDGSVRRLRGAAAIETFDTLLTADEIDYDEETGYAEARGRVKFVNYEEGENLEANRAEYNLRTKIGRASCRERV